MLGTTTTRKTYLSVSKGALTSRSTDGTIERYNYVDGIVTDIYKKERMFNGSKLFFWYIDIADKGEIYSLNFPYYSGVFKSIILSLASVKNIKETRIKIEPYEKNGLQKVKVFADGLRLSWITNTLPPPDQRMEYIHELAYSLYKELSK